MRGGEGDSLFFFCFCSWLGVWSWLVGWVVNTTMTTYYDYDYLLNPPSILSVDFVFFFSFLFFFLFTSPHFFHTIIVTVTVTITVTITITTSERNQKCTRSKKTEKKKSRNKYIHNIRNHHLLPSLPLFTPHFPHN